MAILKQSVLMLLFLVFVASCSNEAPQEEAKSTTEETTASAAPEKKEEAKPTVVGYQVGDIATDFTLKNVDGNMLSMADYPDAKGYVIVFTCNHCPYSIAYEDRLIELDKKYKELGYPVIAINPNDPEVNEDDSYDKMIVRAEEKGFTFPYLMDEGQKIYPQYGATKTPHVYVVNKTEEGNKVAYIGAIDDSKDPAAVKEHYLANALDALIKGEAPNPSFTKAFGCSVKCKKPEDKI
ncbi:thioredoxin family protein [Aureispira sp. CCB-E]|uniref:thioredoxin family protein n=1 Tax=Aureispira sp. CCB-QB1 TaxID=1313421 RepID=UPI000AD7790C|nr:MULTISPECIES: thioredoxin family protein [unclassified Aureispira]WMX14773.1 thioredoxin family protein [Aureispira sp. CCB-E]